MSPSRNKPPPGIEVFHIEKVRENIVMQKYKRKNKKIKKIEAESIDKINFLWRWRILAQ